jgi:hypothetical protein
MGFLCLNTKNKQNVPLETQEAEIVLRDIGLSNVYNVNTEVNLCLESFIGPQYYTSGITKLNTLTPNTACTTGFVYNVLNFLTCPTGYTISAGTTFCYYVSGSTTATTTATTNVIITDLANYNLDYTPNFNFKFIFTGDTSFTSYTGNFCYKIFPKQFFKDSSPISPLLPGQEFINKCIPFNEITGLTVTQSFSAFNNISKNWNEYLVRPYYTFNSKTCNTWNSTNQTNLFNNNTDYYFATTINPPTPVLSGPAEGPRQEYNFLQDVLLANGLPGPQGPQAINNQLNYFLLRELPVSQNIMLFLNGVKLTEGSDYILIYYNGLLSPPVVEINIAPIKSTDWLVANYLVGPPNPLGGALNQWFVDTLLVTTITTDTNPGYVLAMNYNTITGNQEMYLTQPIDPDNAVFLTVNGVQMVEGQQFFKSTSIDNMLIFDNTYTNPIVIGDVVSVFTVSKNAVLTSNDYGEIPTNQFTINWTVPTTIPTNVTSNFKVEVALKSDSGYTSVYYQKTLPFISGVGDYSTTITSIALNNNYRFRVINEAVYAAYLNNKIKTCAHSEGFFSTTSRLINNTY